jgi:outer membrane lipopolysaccharide assembly protein LptE/RlpB
VHKVAVVAGRFPSGRDPVRATLARALLLLAALGLLAGCGFQLRRELVLPPTMSTIRIEQADPYSPLARGLEQALRRAGATIVEVSPGADAATAAMAVLRLPRTEIAQVPLSIGATGRVQEFALRYVVEVELVDAAGAVLVERQPIELERAFSFDTAEALGSPAEAELIRAELEREMVAAILRRIDAALR